MAEAGLTSPSSPPNKTVSFATSHDIASTPPLPDTPPAVLDDDDNDDSPSPNTRGRPPIKRRRSSLKQGIQMPSLPPKEYYQHTDPLLRRLRLNDSRGNRVDLQREFKECTLVLFVFGATWRGSHDEPYKLVEQFARQRPHQVKVVYVSVDDSFDLFQQSNRGRNWMTMEWNDGSNPPDASSGTSDPAAQSDPEEPYLLAGDTDLEEDTSTSDTTGTLYLRPFSRVFLAEKLEILSVPSCAVYHVEKRELLTRHARWDLFKGSHGKMEDTLEKWQRGEKIQLSLGDIAHAMRWTLGFAVAGVSYLAAVHLGGAPNYVASISEKLTRSFMGAGSS